MNINKTLKSMDEEGIEASEYVDIIEKYCGNFSQFNITVGLNEKDSTYLVCAERDKVLVAYRLYEIKNNGRSLYMKREYYTPSGGDTYAKVEPIFNSIGNVMAKDMQFEKQKIHINIDDMHYQDFCIQYLRRGYTIKNNNAKKCSVLSKPVSVKTLNNLT